jgi:hypothetical protein
MTVASKFSDALDFILGLTVTGRTVDMLPGASDPDTFGAIEAAENDNSQLVIQNIPVPDDTAVIEIDLYDDGISGVDLFLEGGQLTLTISRIDADWL